MKLEPAAIAVIPESRRLIRDRKEPVRLPFCDPGSLQAASGMTIREAPYFSRVQRRDLQMSPPSTQPSSFTSSLAVEMT